MSRAYSSCLVIRLCLQNFERLWAYCKLNQQKHASQTPQSYTTPTTLPPSSTHSQQCPYTDNPLNRSTSTESLQPQPGPPSPRIHHRRRPQAKSLHAPPTKRRSRHQERYERHLRPGDRTPLRLHHRAARPSAGRCAQNAEAERVFRRAGGLWVEAPEQCDASAAGTL